MTIEEIIYDVKEIVNAVTDDSDLSDEWILHKINSYGAVIKQEKYRESGGYIDPSWILRTGLIKTERVKPADDPAITYSSVDFSKVALHSVISFPDDAGLTILPSSGIYPLEVSSVEMMAMKASQNKPLPPNMGYYARIGTAAYIWPILAEIIVLSVPENPMDVKIRTSTSYRDRALDDYYPIDMDTAQKAILTLLTKDLKIKMETISDIVNDSQDQLNIMKSGIPGQNNRNSQ